VAAIILATRAALADNRLVAALASAIVLVTTQPVPASVAGYGALITIALIGVAPLIGIALNMRAHSVKKLAMR
jgi:hypothetical protein